MTDATKASILLGTLVLAALVGGGAAAWQARAKAQALHQAAVQEGVAHAALQAEAKAKADKAAAEQVVQQTAARVAELERRLAQHPAPAPAVPVPADAPAAVVVAGLQGLGLAPQVLGPAVKDSLTAQPMALALNLPDGRTILGWGRQAMRVPGLETRMGDLETLTAAQRDQAYAMETRQAAADRALAAADNRAAANQHRAEALQLAIDRTPRWRPRAAGLIAAMDAQGQRHLGALASYSFGPVEIGGLYVNHTAGAFAVIRF